MLVAVTGNIASGKSSVAALFAAQGAFVIDADALARNAVAPGTLALAAIAQRWPNTIRRDGTLDRAALRRLVFSDDGHDDGRNARNALNALNAIVHPEVARQRDALINEARQRGVAIVVYDVPLLFEAGIEGDYDRIVVVDAPDTVRRERLTQYRGLSAAEASAMMSAQLPADGKLARADFVIENDGSQEHLSAQANAVWRALARVVPHG